MMRERMEVTDVDVDLLAGFDIRDLLLEDVRPVLREQACLVSLSARLRIDFFGLLALAKNAANAPLADRHHEFSDRGFLGQREQVHGLDFLRETEVSKVVTHPDVRRLGLTPAQWACLATAALGVYLWRRPPSPPPPPPTEPAAPPADASAGSEP